MAGIYRMIFDASVYYIVTGLYFQAFLEKTPSVFGFLVLCISLLLYGVLIASANFKKPAAIVLLIPLSMLMVGLDLVDMIHFLLIWVYTAVGLLTDRADLDHKAFQKRMLRAIIVVIVALLPGPLMAKPMLQYLGNLLFYVLMMAVFCVVTLRSLRDRDGGLFQLFLILLFLLACGILVYFQIPQSILISITDAISKALGRAGGAAERFFEQIEGNNKYRMDGMEGKSADLQGDMSAPFVPAKFTLNMDKVNLANLILTIVVVIAVSIIVIRLLVLMLENMKQMGPHKKQEKWKDDVVFLEDPESKRKKKHVRPTTTRLTVRYYYWKFMRECKKRGIVIQPGWTAEELNMACRKKFSTEDLRAMRLLYNPARYDHGTEVTGSQARQAAKLWQNMKKTKK